MFSLALLFIVAPQNPTTITYTNIGARIEVVLPELAKLTGLDLEASKEIGGRVLILRLDHAPVKAVLSRIAEAGYGRWKQDGNAQKLVPDTARFDADVEKAKQRHIAEVRESLAKYASAPLRQPEQVTTGEGEKKVVLYTIPGSTPAEPALKALVPYLDPVAIGSQPAGRVVVFSTDPRPLQLPLPDATRPIFGEVLKDRQRKGPPSPDSFPYSHITDQGLNGILAKADVCVCQGSAGLHFRIRLFNTLGRLMVDEVVDLDSMYPWQHLRDGVERKKRSLEENDSRYRADKPLDLSKTEREYLDLRQLPTGHQKPSDELLQQIQAPLNFDPDIYAGEALVAYAKAKNWQLVASPSDQWEVGLPTIVGIEEGALKGPATVDDGTRDGWVVVSDSIEFPDHVDAEHFDRHELAHLLATTTDSQELDLRDLVKAYRTGIGDIWQLPQAWLYPSLIAEVNADGPFLKVLSGASDSDIDLLLSGHTVTLGSLGKSTQDGFAQLVSAQNPRLGLDDGLPPERFADEHLGCSLAEARSEGNRSDDLWQEYTEDASSYSPAEAVIRLYSHDETSLTAIRPKGIPASEPRNPIGIPGPGVFNRLPGTVIFPLGLFCSKMMGQHPSLRYRIGVNHSYCLFVNFAPSVSLAEEMMTTTFTTSAPLLRYEDLTDVQKRTMRLYGELMDETKTHVDFGNRGTIVKPPP